MSWKVSPTETVVRSAGLLAAKTVRSTPALLAVAALVLAASEPFLLLTAFGLEEDRLRLIGTYAMMLAWPTLWVAILATVSRHGERAARCPETTP